MSNLLSQASLVMIPSGYKEDVVYSQIPTNGNGDLSFTRASNGTRVNSAGLVEVCPWNLVTYSNDFSSSWALIEASKSTGVTDPIGNANAIKLKYTTATSAHYITQGITLTGSNAHSVYAKAGELQFLQIASAQSIEEYANFNLSTGAVGTYGTYASNVQIENVGNGWYRCSVVFTNGTNGIYLAIVQSASSDWFGVSTYAGANSTNGLYLYGGQVNAGTLKPYFPTTNRLNVPRLTYQNGGGGCPSLLLEKQSTNIVLNSNNAFDDGTNGSSSTTTTPSVIDGVNYRKMTATAVDGNIFCNVALLSSTPTGLMCFSVFLKKGSCDDVQLIDQNFTGKSIRVNLSNGAIISQSSGLVCGVESYGNDVYRVWIVQDFTSIGFRYDLFAKEIGDFYYTTAQMESGSYPTSVIITNGSSATRVADACFKTGISSLIGQTEGTVFIACESMPTGSTNVLFMLSDGTTNNRVEFYWTNATNGQFVVSRNTSLEVIANMTITQAQRNKIAVVYKQNDFAIYANGVAVFSITSGLVPSSLTKMEFSEGSGFPYMGKINQAVIFPTRLTNAELASLTTI